MTEGIGHNSVGSEAAEQLRSTVERIEVLETEKKDLAEDIKEVYAVAKSKGYDVKIIRQVIARRKKDRSDVEETDALVAAYEGALLNELLG